MFVAIALLPTVAAVAAQEIVQLSPDTYMVIRDSKAGAFASMAKLKAETIAAANSYASSQGKVAIPISSKETRAPPFSGRWPSFEYQFRLVDANDPAAKSTGLSAPTRDGVSEAISPSPVVQAATTGTATSTDAHSSGPPTRDTELRQNCQLIRDQIFYAPNDPSMTEERKSELRARWRQIGCDNLDGPRSVQTTIPPNVGSTPNPETTPQAAPAGTGMQMTFDECFQKCKTLTSRTAEQCFDACKR